MRAGCGEMGLAGLGWVGVGWGVVFAGCPRAGTVRYTPVVRWGPIGPEEYVLRHSAFKEARHGFDLRHNRAVGVSLNGESCATSTN